MLPLFLIYTDREEENEEHDMLIIQTAAGLKYVKLNKHKLVANLPFQSYSAELRVETRGNNTVTINTASVR